MYKDQEMQETECSDSILVPGPSSSEAAAAPSLVATTQSRVHITKTLFA